MGESNEIKIIQVLKVTILSRFTRIISSLSFKEETKAVIKIVWFFVILFLYIHVISCVWFYVVNVHQVWIPPLEWLEYENSVFFLEETDTQYMMVVYYMIACMGGNELGPRNPLECIIIVVLMLMAALINANLFGEMAFLATIISKKSTIYQGKVDTANTAMKNIHMDDESSGKVRMYFLFT